MKFLGQAKKFLKVLATEPETTAQHFNVRCASGHRVRGERTEGYQALRCPACGEGVFVLPRSPLPLPPPPKRADAAPRRRSIEPALDEGPVELQDPARVSVDLGGGDLHAPADADIVWDDELPEPAPPAPRKTTRPAPAGSVDLGVAGPPDAAAVAGAHGASASAAHAPEEQAGAAANTRTAILPEPPPRSTISAIAANRQSQPRARHSGGAGQGEVVLEIKPASRLRTLNRWLIALVPLLVIGTVAWRYRQYQRQQFPLVAEKGRTEGIRALEEGEFDKAHQLLSAARSAVDAPGGAVKDADDIRQAADEAAIFVNLSNQDLGDMLDEAGRTDDPDAWDSRFASVYKGRSVLIDSIVIAVPDGTAGSSYDLALRIFPRGESRNRDGRPDRYGRVRSDRLPLVRRRAASGQPRDLRRQARIVPVRRCQGPVGRAALTQVGRLDHTHQGARVAGVAERFGSAADPTDGRWTMRRTILAVVWACILGFECTSFGRFQEEATPVEPAELARRDDLVGKKVALDDHVRVLRGSAG